MKQKCKKILHIIIISSSFIGILLQCGLGSSSFSLSTFRMFTTLSNLAVLLYFLFDFFISRNELMKKLKFAVTMCILLTGCVASILLRGMFDSMEPLQKVGIFLLHDVTPIATVLDWLLFDEKGNTTKQMPLFSTIFPYTYLAFIFITAPFTSTMQYPYPFIDVPTLGVPLVILNCIGLSILFILVGYLGVWIDRKLKK